MTPPYLPIAAALALATLLGLSSCQTPTAEVEDAYAYLVTFDSQGAAVAASPSMKAVQSPAGTIDELPAAPEDDGRSFLGWYTEPNGGGTQFTAATAVTGDLTVYANFTIEVIIRQEAYSITYNLNGGTNDAGNPATQDISVALTLAAPTRERFRFGGWYTSSTLSGSAVTEIPAGSIEQYGSVELWAKWVYDDRYNLGLGDVGPAGGRICYVNLNANADGWKYLELAPDSTEWSGVPFGSYQWHIWGADGVIVGTGAQNTQDIVSQHNSAHYMFGIAARLCSELSFNGYDDWFLPSIDELTYAYLNVWKPGKGIHSEGRYWSSTEKEPAADGTKESTYCYACYFDTALGCAGVMDSFISRYVRAMRSF
ncbi:MAG TPA: InlB B-repeat-containing protein [Spirochaetales bacterium]|nr:InlB B-repeat-containing protein [Spirochaetales bacterium]HRY53639.1 InlB B-repeat-containing protein [Spirochaetia bacterium]HRZ63730.1 InlB B-repeat-containing protein [Spirochaetia bacterium]